MTGVRSHEAGGAGREATAMRIAAPQGNDDQAWLALRSALWPDATDFVEGLYVVAGSRRQGVARALVESVVKWALQEGLSELASDSLLDNSAAHAAHQALGFAETERVVYFRRALRDV